MRPKQNLASMKKALFVLASTTIILGIVFALLYGLFPSSYKLTSYSVYEISYNFALKNNLGKSADLFVMIPQIKNIRPQQKIYDLSMNKKYKLLGAANGNKSYLVKLENIPSGGEEKIQIHFRAKIYHIEQKLIPLKSAAGSVQEQYLQSEPDIEAYSPLIKAAAVDSTKNEDNDYYKIVKLYDFARKKLTYEENKRCATALSVLKTKKAQCADATLLLIALCRSVNIPAKFEAGIFYNNEDGSSTKTHSWAQIYAKNYGWIYADPTLGRFNPETRYRCLAEIRDKYITLWENDRLPFNFYLNSPNFDKNKIDATVSYEIKKIKEKNLFNPESLKVKLIPAFAGIKNTPLVKKSDKSYEVKTRITGLYGENRLQEAEKEFNILYGKNPQDLYCLYCLGLINALYSNYSSAVNYFKKAIELGLKDEYIYNSLAYIYIQTKETALAEKYLIESLKYSTHYKNSFDNLVYIALIQQEWQKVLFWANLAEKYNSNNPDFNFNSKKAIAYLKLKNYKNALNYAEKALKLNSQNTWMNLLLGQIYYEQGDLNKAYSQMAPFIEKATPPERQEFLPLYEKIKKAVLH